MALLLVRQGSLIGEIEGIRHCSKEPHHGQIHVGIAIVTGGIKEYGLIK